MNHLGLFEGIGGFSLAARWAGWETVAWVEKDEHCQKVLKKNFPNTKGYADIFEFSGIEYKGRIDIVTGGFPCQPFSHAGEREGTEATWERNSAVCGLSNFSNHQPTTMTTELQTYSAQLPTVPDVSPTQVEWIARVRQSPVLRMDEDQATTAVVAALVQIAPYLSELPENHVSREFAKVFKSAYPLLNPLECKAAVMMQTTGKLGESDNRIFYGGKFSISTMCAILNAYQEWRQKVVAAIIHAEDEARKEQERLKQKAAWIEALAVDKAAFLRGEYGALSSWEEIPVYWLKWANQAGLLTWEEGEAAALRDEAERMATAETEHKNLAFISDGRIDQVLKGERFLDSIELRAKVIRAKLAIWRKLANKEIE